MSVDVRELVAAAARRIAEEGLVLGTAGNVSVRDGDRVAVTASGAVLARCTADDVVLVGRDGIVPDGEGRPTSELALHLGIYADAPETSAVVHTHAPFSVAVSCVLSELPVLHYQQLALGGSIRVAPYATFGTPALAGHVRAALSGRQAALMANHGSVALGGTLDQAVENALLLEWCAALHQRASALGTPRALTEQEQADVVRVAVERNYGHRAPTAEEQS